MRGIGFVSGVIWNSVVRVDFEVEVEYSFDQTRQCPDLLGLFIHAAQLEIQQVTVLNEIQYFALLQPPQ
jgi:hypothetical protein